MSGGQGSSFVRIYGVFRDLMLVNRADRVVIPNGRDSADPVAEIDATYDSPLPWTHDEVRHRNAHGWFS